MIIASWLKYKFMMLMIRYFFVKAGPLMFTFRDYWMFVDVYGDIYRITYTAQYGNPLMIVLEKKQ